MSDWACARCVALKQRCYAKRGRGGSALCTDCAAELRLDGARWCVMCRRAVPRAQMAVAKSYCRPCAQARNQPYRAAYHERHREAERAARRAHYAQHRATVAYRRKLLALRRLGVPS